MKCSMICGFALAISLANGAPLSLELNGPRTSQTTMSKGYLKAITSDRSDIAQNPSYSSHSSQLRLQRRGGAASILSVSLFDDLEEQVKLSEPKDDMASLDVSTMQKDHKIAIQLEAIKSNRNRIEKKLLDELKVFEHDTHEQSALSLRETIAKAKLHYDNILAANGKRYQMSMNRVIRFKNQGKLTDVQFFKEVKQLNRHTQIKDESLHASFQLKLQSIQARFDREITESIVKANRVGQEALQRVSRVAGEIQKEIQEDKFAFGTDLMQLMFERIHA